MSRTSRAQRTRRIFLVISALMALSMICGTLVIFLPEPQRAAPTRLPANPTATPTESIPSSMTPTATPSPTPMVAPSPVPRPTG